MKGNMKKRKGGRMKKGREGKLKNSIESHKRSTSRLKFHGNSGHGSFTVHVSNVQLVPSSSV
jgi:hypothetical protein